MVSVEERGRAKASKRDLLDIFDLSGDVELQPPIRPIKWVPIKLIDPWRFNNRKNLSGDVPAADKIREFVDAMRRGDQFPPIVAFPYRKNKPYRYRIFDGRHRARAAQHFGCQTVRAVVVPWKTICGFMSYWEDFSWVWESGGPMAAWNIGGDDT
jgi:uncharacterized ParB-like nuclease family protein